MSYTVILDDRTEKAIQALPHKLRGRIYQAITKLEVNPKPPGVRKMRGRINGWRIRVGDYRVVYTIEEDRLVVLVIKVAHRRHIYR